MRKDLLIIALGLSLASGTAGADVLATPEAATPEAAAPESTTPATTAPSAATAPSLPAKGTPMAAVEKKYGNPAQKRPTVGGDTPKHPPITRWDYAGFSVIFEHDKVVDAVIPGAPPRVYHQDRLTPVASSAPALTPPPMTPPPVEAKEFTVPAAEAAPLVAPAEMQIKEKPMEPAAASAPAEVIAPMPAPKPAAPAESSTYPDGPATAPDGVPEAPPTPK